MIQDHFGEWYHDPYIEVGETYIGGKERNKSKGSRKNIGRGIAGKTAVLGLRSRDGGFIALPIANTSKETIHSVIKQYVEKGSTICSDDHKSYLGLDLEGYKHSRVIHSKDEYVVGNIHTNSIESCWAVLKRGIYGTFHHISDKHLGLYVDEFAFRLSACNVKRDTADRLVTMAGNMKNTRITYKELIAN